MSDVTELRGEASAAAAEVSRRAALSALAAAAAPEADVPALVSETGRTVYAGGDVDVVLLEEASLTYFDAAADSRVYPTGYAGDHALVTVPACTRLTGLGIALTAEDYANQRAALLDAVAAVTQAEDVVDELEQVLTGEAPVSAEEVLAAAAAAASELEEQESAPVEGLFTDEELLEASAVELKDYLALHPGEADRVEAAENLRDDPRKTVLAALAAVRQA